MTPHETRNVEAVFVHPCLEPGPIEQARVRVGNEVVLKGFVARNIRAIMPVKWENSMGENVVVPLENAELTGEIVHGAPDRP